MPTVLMEKRDRVAYLTLNRPGAHNALSPELVTELEGAIAETAADAELRALVLRGAGPSFCAGADLKFISERGLHHPGAALVPYIEALNRTLFALEALPVPTVALVHGYCLAGGLELALACDIVLAAEDARIGDQHVNFALMPGGGSSQRLPRKVGWPRAMALLLTGRWISGREAESWGLAYRAAPRERLEEELEALLSDLRGKSRQALAHIKRAALDGMGLPLATAVRLEVGLATSYLATSSDVREGLSAFLEKRQPRF
jgi:enoyl-CoA hydratase